MELTIKGEFAKHFVAQAKKDQSLADALAREYVATVDRLALRKYLLTRDVALGLLADRLRKRPEQTFGELSKLASGGPPAQRSTGHRPVAARKRKRQRLSTARVGQIKDQVRKFLAAHPWSNRKQIAAAGGIPTPAIYNRIMGELRQARLVVARGQKAKTVYAVKGAKPSKSRPAKRGAKRR
jgi:hypothetical protein